MNDYIIVEIFNNIEDKTYPLTAKNLTAAKRHATRHATWCHPEISILDGNNRVLTRKGLATGHKWFDN